MEILRNSEAPELEHVELESGVYDAFVRFSSYEDTVSIDRLRQASEEGSFNGELRKSSGKPVSETEALAVLEQMQANGYVDIEGHDGIFRVLNGVERQSSGPKKIIPGVNAPNYFPDFPRRSEMAGNTGPIKKLGLLVTRMASETKTTGAHYGRGVGAMATGLSTAVTGTSRRKIAEQERKAQEVQQKYAEWQAQRKTTLTLILSPAKLERTQGKVAYNTDTIRELRHVDDEIEERIRNRVRSQPGAKGKLLPRAEFTRITNEVRSEVIREYLGEDTTEDDVEEFSALLHAYRPKKRR